MSLMSFAIFGQNPNWLPMGSVLAYDVFCHEYISTIQTVKVTNAYFENNTDVRILEAPWMSWCLGFPTEAVFTLHRREEQVFYVDTLGTEYMLYDYAALPGDTIRAITSIPMVDEPMYTELVVDFIDTLFVQDTFLLVQVMDKYVDYSYGDVIIDLVATHYLFPPNGVSTSGSSNLAAYGSPVTATICFITSACQLIRSDFDYSPFHTDAGIYYEDSGGHIYSIQVIDPNPGNDTVVLEPNSSIVNKHSDCFVVDQFGWAFDRVEIYSTTQFDIFNINGEPITIILDRSVGEEWVSYSKGIVEIMAYVKSRDTDTVIYNKVDSVLTIGFKHPSSPQSQLNNMELKISKSYGILQLMSFLHFPDYSLARLPYEKLKLFRLKGMDFDADNHSYLNTTWQYVNSHKVGDQLHIEESYTEFGIGSLYQDRLRYLGGIYENGSTFLYWSREGRHVVKNAGNDEQVNFVRDTLRWEYNKNYGKTSGFDTRPGDAIVFNGNSATYAYGGLFNGHSKKTVEPVRWLRVDTCWEEIITFANTYASTWISRLGGDYYDRSDQSTNNYRELKYYRLNSGEEWGEPFDFIVATSNPDEPVQIKVYPNPANDFIYIEGDMLSHTAEYEIYDLGGRLRLKENNISSTPINVSTLEAGIYFYKITDHNTTVSGKLVIAK